MRLDKFLKVSRILKRRTISKELAENQRILVNGKIAKPAKEINVGDTIQITYGQRVLEVKVLEIKDVVRKNDASILYEVVKEYTIDEDNRAV